MTMTDNAGPEDFKSRMQQTMQDFAAAWGRCDIDALMDLVGADPVYRTSSGAVFTGRDQVRAGFTKICQPAPAGQTPPPSSQGTMRFFDSMCISYWTLPLTNADGVRSFVEGVDVISFDAQAKLVCKDAYRKLA